MRTPDRADDSLSLSTEEHIDAVCRRFEAAWKAGERPRLEDYLAGTAEPQSEVLLRELLRLELEYRRRAGEQPATADYCLRLSGHEGLLEALFGTVVLEESEAVHVSLAEDVGPQALVALARIRDAGVERSLA